MVLVRVLKVLMLLICHVMYCRIMNYAIYVVRSLRAGVQPTLDRSAETFISVQCASPGKGGELVGVCGVCARCVG